MLLKETTVTDRHTCHAMDCETAVPEHMHMCRPHWFRVPRKLQRELWAAYVPGQETRKDPSREYLLAAERCINAVAAKEGLITEAERDERVIRLATSLGLPVPEDLAHHQKRLL